ncbi:MAG: YwiC-like family protein [Proteobacteria bacterium]|nr:YwiC-like family protein [Pseudomonadota bacterium]
MHTPVSELLRIVLLMHPRHRVLTPRALLGPPPWPREHGAWAMLSAPLAMGIALGGPRARHAPLVFALLFAYLALAALRERLRPLPSRDAAPPSGSRQQALRQRHSRWALIYAAATLACGAGLLVATPDLRLLALGGGAATVLQLALIRRGLDRSLPGSVLAIATLALACPAAYAVGRGVLDAQVWWTWGWTTCFFTGSLLFVRSLLRARGDARVAAASSAFHAAVSAIAALLGQPLVALAFALATARTLVLWRRRLRPALIGGIEAANALAFTVLVVLARR